jgi:histone deacetylase 11
MAAMERGWAINLGGGFHHASADDGGGFCFYSDIALGIKVLRSSTRCPEKIMIIDLDAHQGNGYERDFLQDESIYILDMYNAAVYPNDIKAKLAIDRNIELNSGIGDVDYLDRLSKEMELAFEDFTPGLIFYNAGTDIMTGDPLGRMNISERGIIARDEMVFSKALSEKVPIVMLLSGGYQKENAAVIAKSIHNILKIVS